MALAGSPTTAIPSCWSRSACGRSASSATKASSLARLARSWATACSPSILPSRRSSYSLTWSGWIGRPCSKAGNRLELYLYLNRTSADLEQNVAESTFQLACTPVINLYKQRAEPIRLSHTQTEYRVVPDARRPLANEVYSIDRVTATSADNEQVEYQPFYSFRHATDRFAAKTFWYATRRPAEQCGGQVDQGSEVYVSLVDLDFKTSVPSNWTLDIETTCLNRESALPVVLGQRPVGVSLDEGSRMSHIACVTGRPTPTLRPALKRAPLGD